MLRNTTAPHHARQSKKPISKPMTIGLIHLTQKTKPRIKQGQLPDPGLNRKVESSIVASK